MHANVAAAIDSSRYPALLVALLLALGQPALAYRDGSAGHSGKIAGLTCNECHFGGKPLTVTIDGDTHLVAGQTTTLTLTLSTDNPGLRAGGFALAASAGELGPNASEPATGLLGAELVQSQPKLTNNGSVSWTFDFTAPVDSPEVLLYAGGVIGNGDDSDQGDQQGTTQFSIAITGTTATPISGEAPRGRRLPDEYYGGCSASPSPSAPRGLFGMLGWTLCALYARRRLRRAI
ncbi:MAG: hypothetical protein H6707_12425 [Deltaproteobacteria bacterium]|nr:hypothetical protein [Deltaproteobacteria bacterium]